MIQLNPEELAAAKALAEKMKTNFPKYLPKIAIFAIHILMIEIAVQLSAGKKKAALDYLKAMAHDGRDSIRRYFAAAEAKKLSDAEKRVDALVSRPVGEGVK